MSVSIPAFALGAAGAVDGADVLEINDITQRLVQRVGGAAGQTRGAGGEAQVAPQSHLMVVGPVWADGAEVSLLADISLEEDGRPSTGKLETKAGLEQMYRF